MGDTKDEARGNPETGRRPAVMDQFGTDSPGQPQQHPGCDEDGDEHAQRHIRALAVWSCAVVHRLSPFAAVTGAGDEVPAMDGDPLARRPECPRTTVAVGSGPSGPSPASARILRAPKSARSAVAETTKTSPPAQWAT